MIKTINLLTVPYDSGHFNKRTGCGPLHIVNHGLVRNLQVAGYAVDYKQITVEEKFPTEIASTIRLLYQIKSDVTASIQNQSFPIILSGNCCATVGAVAGLAEPDAGVIWFDAHGDCETPETTASGFLDGMALSMLTHSCWRNLLSSFNIYSHLSGKRIMLIGARDLSKYEKRFIAANDITHITVDQIEHSRQQTLKSSCAEFTQTGIKKLHVHIDIDVIDPSIARANSYSVDNGLSKENLIETINYCISKIPAISVTIASYDPLFDSDDRILDTINEVVENIVKHI